MEGESLSLRQPHPYDALESLASEMHLLNFSVLPYPGSNRRKSFVAKSVYFEVSISGRGVEGCIPFPTPRQLTSCWLAEQGKKDKR